MERICIKVFGKVQGVYYRQSTEAVAKSLGVFGWIKNCPDGTVEVVGEGEKKRLDEFLDWCKRGPVSAKVEKTEVRWEKAKNEFQEFRVIRLLE